MFLSIILRKKEGHIMSKLLDRFLSYVKIDTQSDPFSETFPSTAKQKTLSLLLVDELKAIGLDAFLDEFGYVYTKLASNTNKKVAPIGFIAHVDTSFDAPGGPVNPRVIKHYDGGVIKLNQELSMSAAEFDSLKRVIGDDLVVTDGNTLLGADDKCGVAEIMQLAEYLQENPQIKHGDIYICFTPDEEIGKGANHFNHDWFKADFAYTLDGSYVGGVEYENFNAASAAVTFIGKSIHPGSAKGKMINALHLAFEFHSMLPEFLNPAYTEGYEGFNHINHIKGQVEDAESLYIIRNHDKALFASQKESFTTIASYLNKKYGYDAVKVVIKDSYFNMYEIIKDHMHIIELAKDAIIKTGLTPEIEPIRGGTDGARLTFDGLPCPNLGTGGFNFHGRFEFASVNQMELALKVLINLVDIHTNR